MEIKHNMRTIIRSLALAVLSLVAMLVPPGRAPQRLYAEDGLLAGAPAACEDGLQTTGATYRICMPATWNNKLVVYAHGYVAPNQPLGIPEDQMTLPGTNTTVDQIVTAQGYAFATSGYRVNGLAIREGLGDLVDLVGLFTTLKGEPVQVLLAGVSEGGLITALAVERHPDLFDGGLALCGPYGSFTGQIDYFGDFRVIFEYYFPGLIPGTVVEVPPELLDTWETGFYSDTVKPAITDPANAVAVDQLLAVTGAPFDSGDPASKERTIKDVLWYNIFATNDAREKLGGQPYHNLERRYSGSSDDEQLNGQVHRIAADQAALDAISADYETTGVLSVPFVTLHTTRDPVVPYAHATQYLFKTIAADNIALHEHRRVDAYGHCQLSPLAVLGAFSRLQAMVDDPPPYRPATRLQLPLVGQP